jgi:hypothetical protein
MALSAFDDKGSRPDARALASTLGRSHAHWRAVIDGVRAAYGPVREEWSFAGANYGWSLRLKNAKKAIVYLTPRRGDFLASFALGEKACRAARERDISPQVLAIIDAAPRYVEGRGVRIPVRSAKAVSDVMRIAALKMC